ncbi:MAG: hypothetical protein BAJALOKI3v1_150062 [Promethearchaeota archaeon]|nr:MAG: hypothetical protein BAJALOKI3v1_150062 [Candidatus Lokiarchaeota archaeon]
MSIKLTESAKTYIQEHRIDSLLLDVNTIQEGCTAIYSPNLTIISHSSDSDLDIQYAELVERKNLKLYISNRFLETFGPRNEFYLDMKGFFDKILIVSNIEAKTKDICKV